MENLFEVHKPASIKKEYFDLIEILEDGTEFKFIEESKSYSKLNRYLIEMNQLRLFIDMMNKCCIINSVIKLNNKVTHLNRIQLLRKKKELLKLGWNHWGCVEDTFYKQIETPSDIDANVLKDFYLTSILVFHQKNTTCPAIDEIIEGLSFDEQPLRVGFYYPTHNALEYLHKNNIGFLYSIKHFYETSVNEERDIYLCYLPFEVE